MAAEKPDPLAWAVLCANGQVHRVAPRVPEQVFTGCDAEKAARLSAENAIGHCGPHRAVPLVEQGSDAGLRERLRALVKEFGNQRAALLQVANNSIGTISERCFAKASAWEGAHAQLAALLEQAPSAPAPDTEHPTLASFEGIAPELEPARWTPTEREAALVAITRRAKVWIGHHGHSETQWEARQWELLMEELQRTLAAYEERATSASSPEAQALPAGLPPAAAGSR